MSDESQLNPELKKLEATLGRLPIPPASIDRDELMYQSGWAAAMASLGHETVPASSIATPAANQQWIWQASTMVATAAAILFGTMLLNQSLNQGEVEMAIAKNVVPSGVEIAQPISTEPAEDANVVTVPDLLQLVMDLPDSKTLHAGMVVGPNFPVDSKPSLKSPVSPSSGNLTPPMTQQELLDELLPNRFDRSPKWSLFRLGGNS
jgi:hypothetical protein